MGVDSASSNNSAEKIDLRHVLALMREGNWRAAHDMVQLDATEPGAWLHGLLHVQEGDLEDAEYWFGRAGRNFRSRGTLEEELEQLDAVLKNLPGAAQVLLVQIEARAMRCSG
jgi:hypothetical protein